MVLNIYRCCSGTQYVIRVLLFKGIFKKKIVMTELIFRNSNFDQPREEVCLLHTCNWFEKTYPYIGLTGNVIFLSFGYKFAEQATHIICGIYWGMKIFAVTCEKGWNIFISYFVIPAIDKCNERDNYIRLEIFQVFSWKQYLREKPLEKFSLSDWFRNFSCIAVSNFYHR